MITHEYCSTGAEVRIFSFCHWEAETEDDIHDLLEKTGMALNIVTMPQEMHRFVTTYDITDEKMLIPPRKL